MIIRIFNGVPYKALDITSDENLVKFYPLSLNLFNDFTQSDIKTWSDPDNTPDVIALLKARGIDVKNNTVKVVPHEQGKHIQVTLANDQVVVFDYQKSSKDDHIFQLKQVYASHDTLSNQLARQPLPKPNNLNGLVKVPMDTLGRFLLEEETFIKNAEGQYLLNAGSELSRQFAKKDLIRDLPRNPVVIDGKRCTKESELPTDFDSRFHPQFYYQAMNGMLEHLLKIIFSQTSRKSSMTMSRAISKDSSINYYTVNGVSHCTVLERNYKITNPLNKDTVIFIPGYIVFDYETTKDGYIVNAYASPEMKFFLDAYYQEQERIRLIVNDNDKDQAFKELITNASIKAILIDINNLKTTITPQLSELRTLGDNTNSFTDIGMPTMDTTYINIDLDFSNLMDECLAHGQELAEQGDLDLALEYLTQVKTMCTILDTGLTQETPATEVRKELVDSYNTFKEKTQGTHDTRNIFKFLLKILQMLFGSDTSNTASPTYLLKNRQNSLGEIIDKLPPTPPTYKA
jgi:hypothetical protein